MRTIFFVIILVSLLLSAQTQKLAPAALPQPDVQDWKTLAEDARQTKEGYDRIVDFATEQLKFLTDLVKDSNPGGVPTINPLGVPTINPLSSGDHKLEIAHFNKILTGAKKAVTALTAINTELNGMKPADRTRAKYLQLRRQVKEWQVQYMADQRAQYEDDSGMLDIGMRMGGMPRMSEAAVIENRLAALKANPPEMIPIGPRPKGLELDWQTLPRLDGSTTAQPLSTLIVCRTLGLGAVWQYRSIWGNGEESSERILVPQCSGSPMPSDGSPYSYYNSGNTAFPGLQLSLALTGTNNAYRNLILGTSDFIIVARPPSADELKLAKDKGIELESRTIAYDAFILILNSANPVSNLTIKQIQDIYQDNVLRWSEVGGSKEKMTAFQRERNSGSQETMQELVMKGLTMAPPVEQLIGQGMGGPYNKLDGQQNGISYTFYYYQTVQAPVNQTRVMRPGDKKPIPPIKVCAVDGIMPTSETIRNRTYPYVTRVYAIIRKDTAKVHPSVRLRDWLLTPEGQALVKESGYVPLPEKDSLEIEN